MDQDYLSLLPYDVLSQVCASASSDPNIRAPLDGLSKSNKHLRDVSLPEVFSHIVIRGHWDFASSRLKAMEECHAFLPFIRIFKFDIYERDEALSPPQSMPSQLANLLSAMSQLQKLVFVVPEHHSDLFGEAFRYAELVVPSVDVLVVGPHCEFMVAICPNVTMICGKRQHSMNLMKAAGAASKLRHFEMTQSWEISSLEALLESMPNIASIGMKGGLHGIPLEEFVPILSRFKDLRTLALDGARLLNVGFDPPSCRKYVSVGPGGVKLHRERAKSDEEEAERKVAHMVFPACASLGQLWIGDTTKAVGERSPDGSLKKITMFECDRDKVVKYPRP